MSDAETRLVPGATPLSDGALDDSAEGVLK